MSYTEDGYIHIKHLITREEITTISKYISKLPPKIFLPNSHIPWGYGNLLEDPNLNHILSKEKLTATLKGILKVRYIFNHLLVTNKHKWVGPPVEWHQEMSLAETYASGYTLNDTDKLIQIYIAIDKHTVENGCLRIFPKSHKLGLLEHEDIIGYNLNHKKQLTLNSLDYLHSKSPVTAIEMEPGDCLIFSHLLAHGSSSNNTPNDRKAFIIQARTCEKEIDRSKFNEYSKVRKEYTLNFFKNKIKETEGKNIYKDFVKYDKKTVK